MQKIGTMSDGLAEDQIRSFQQLVCAEGHYKTLIEKYQSQLANGLINVENEEVRTAHLQKLEDAIEELQQIAELRRSTMRFLMELYSGDTDYWCLVKHLSSADYCAFEVYQASDNDAELLNLYLEIHARFVHAITRFLGTEITDCSACLTDALRKGAKKDG